MASVDWFSYFLHPERLHAELGPHSIGTRWATPAERRTAAAQVLHGLLGTNNFRAFVLSAYPAIGDLPGRPAEKYVGPTPPSTPLSPTAAGGGGDSTDMGSARRIGQCARFEMSPETGLPTATLAEVLRANGLPELSARQERLLSLADSVAGLAGLEVEDVESSVHATIRFMHYLHLLESSAGAENAGACQTQYRRWTVRAAYREEEAGLSMEVESSPAMDVNCRHLRAHAEALDESDAHGRAAKYRVVYDLGRVLLAQSRFSQALDMFRECQRIDPARCRTDKFALARRRAQPSVDQYVDACAAIVQSMDAGGEQAGTPTCQFDAMSIGAPQQDARIASLVEANDYDQAARLCLLSALSRMPASPGSGPDDLLWTLSIHPRLLAGCSRRPPRDIARTLGGAVSERVASEGLSAADAEALERQAAAVARFIAGDALAPPCTEPDPGAVGPGGTVVEDQALARNTLELDTSKNALVMVQLSHCYLSGLRLLEKEQFRNARVWFARGTKVAAAFPLTQPQPQSQPQPGPPLMAQNAEKDKILRAAVESQLAVHAQLADLFCQIEAGADIDDLAEDIDAVMEAQVAIRFEFLERIVAACLRQGNRAVFARLVGTIATNQKLYQQLPEIHLALLQVASLLVLIRDILQGLGIDVARDMTGGGSGSGPPDVDLDALPAEDLRQLQASVSEVALLLLKIPAGMTRSTGIGLRPITACALQPGAKSESEVERFCRMWGDPVYLTLLGALLAEMLQAGDGGGSGEHAPGPSWFCALIARIVRPVASHSNGRGHAPMDTDGPAALSIVGSTINSATEQGRKNMLHMQDLALTVLRCAARATPTDACVWLYFSTAASAASEGERLGGLFIPTFVEFLALHTQAFSPEALGRCVGQPWFQQRLPAMVRSLAALKMSGAAAVLHQCGLDINYSAAMPLVAQAFERAEIDQAVAGFFWDPDIIEYAQHLSRRPTSAVRLEFAVPNDELTASKTLILSAFFQWLSAALCTK